MRTDHVDAFAKIRATKINFYINYMISQGVPAIKLLMGTDLSQAKLKSNRVLVEVSDYIRIVSNMIRLAETNTLAFELGKKVRLGDLGVLGHAISACENAFQSIPLWIKYNQLFFGSLITNLFRQDEKYYKFEFVPKVKLQPYLLQFFLEEQLSIERTIFSPFNNCNFYSASYSFTYPPPRHANLYSELLGTKAVKFNAAENHTLLRIDDSYESLKQVYPDADCETVGICIKHLDDVSSTVINKTTLTSTLRLTITENLPKILTVDEIAEELKYGTRTFRRRIEGENTNYQEVLSKVREEMAKNYLATTSLNLAEISELLGFENYGSLSRAFKLWTGLTMNEYRKSLKASTLKID